LPVAVTETWPATAVILVPTASNASEAAAKSSMLGSTLGSGLLAVTGAETSSGSGLLRIGASSTRQ
jgi:hypothetical protein